MAGKNPTVLPVADLETTTPGMFIEVKVRHQKGGINYFNYAQEAGGFYLSVGSVTIEPRGGMVMRSQMMGDGYKSLIDSTERFNAKRLERLAGEALKSDTCKRLVEQVCLEKNLVLVKPLE